MYNLQATLREITVEVVTIQEITVEVVDLPLFLDMSDLEVEDQLPPPPEVVYVPWDTFPDLSPAQLGLRIDNSILHA